MFDLPPTLPVITECAAAVVESWQEAEACVLGLGFERSDEKAYWTQVEADYWDAIALSNRAHSLATEGHAERAAKEAVMQMVIETLQADSGTLLPMGEPFLTTDIDKLSFTNVSGLHRFYVMGETTSVVLLDDGAGASITVFSSQPWEEFDGFWNVAASEHLGQKNVVPARLAKTEWLHCFSEDITLYPEKPDTNCPNVVDFELMQVNTAAFEALLGRSSNFQFEATFSAFRE